MLPESVPGTRSVAAAVPAGASGVAESVVGTEPKAKTVAERFAQQDFLQDESAKQELLRDRARKLAAQYVQDAERDLDRADIEAALANFATALSVDPTNKKAQEGFQQARALAGDTNASAEQLLRDQRAFQLCLLYTSPSPRDQRGSRMPSSA